MRGGRLLAWVLAFLALVASATAERVEALAPAEAARRVASGDAVLVDVREAEEWEGGVVGGAALLPLSDLQGKREGWRPFLEANRDKQIILYCRSGNRSGVAARLLAKETFRVANAGGFGAWVKAGVEKVEVVEEGKDGESN